MNFIARRAALSESRVVSKNNFPVELKRNREIFFIIGKGVGETAAFVDGAIFCVNDIIEVGFASEYSQSTCAVVGAEDNFFERVQCEQNFFLEQVEEIQFAQNIFGIGCSLMFEGIEVENIGGNIPALKKIFVEFGDGRQIAESDAIFDGKIFAEGGKVSGNEIEIFNAHSVDKKMAASSEYSSPMILLRESKVKKSRPLRRASSSTR